SDPRDSTRRQYLSPALVWLLRQAACVFVQTRLEHNVVRDAGIDTGKLEILGMGVEPRECAGGDRDKARRAWNVDRDEVVVGHLANNSEEKGTVDLLSAADAAWRAGASFRLVLAGPA